MLGRLGALVTVATLGLGVAPFDRHPLPELAAPHALAEANQRKVFLPSALRDFSGFYYRAAFDGSVCDWQEGEDGNTKQFCDNGTFVYRFKSASTLYFERLWASVGAADYEISADLRFDPSIPTTARLVASRQRTDLARPASPSATGSSS